MTKNLTKKVEEDLKKKIHVFFGTVFEGLDLMKVNQEKRNAENRGALRLLSDERIPFINMGPTGSLPTPRLEYGIWVYSGLNRIKEFVERYKEGKLPPYPY